MLSLGFGWEYRTRDADLDGAPAVYAHADVYDVRDKFILSTDQSFLALGNFECFASCSSY